METVRQHWENRYAEGFLPWDSGVTPPEVEAFWRAAYIPVEQRNGRWAIDLGCGTGTNLAYLARQGLCVVGVELAANALTIARQRIREQHAPLSDRIHLVQGSVTAVPLQDLGASYILDIGCFHTVPPAERAAYAQGVIDNLAPGGFYQAYAFDWMEDRAADPQKSPRGLRENEVVELFTPALEVVQIERAQPNPHPCRWYLLRKL